MGDEKTLSPEELSQITGGAKKPPLENSPLSDKSKKPKKNSLVGDSIFY